MSRVRPSSPQASRRMSKVRQTGTAAEVALRRELYRNGLRYRVDFSVLKRPRRVADIVFPSLGIAIFVDGCFWHGCPDHASWPKKNADFWRSKIEANRLRDADTNFRLEEIGWTVLRFWAHESPIDAAETVTRLVITTRSKRRELRPASYKKNRTQRLRTP
jgi:DNA mismatch endonuclease, patch repair protein